MTVTRPREGSISSTRALFGSQKADVSIDIIVIGASVAGLACAYSLQEAGHNVLVLEAKSDLGKSPGGVRIPPNMSRILLKWGLGPRIAELTSGRCPKINFHSGHTGEAIGELLFHEAVMKELQAEVYLLHHLDLLRMLYQLAKDSGAQFRFGSRVAQLDPEAPSVTLSCGEKLYADLIVGGDGYQSVVHSVLEHIDNEDGRADYSSYLFTVPASSFKDDAELLQLVKEPTWNVWMGSGWSLLGHAVRNNTEFVATIFRDETGTKDQLDWQCRTPVGDLDLERFGFAPIIKRLLKLVKDTVRIRDERATNLEGWYDDNGHVVVVGEAAHELNPGSTHGAAMAVEDAAVLGRLLSKLKSKDDIVKLLTGFQEIRQARCEIVRNSEQEKVEFMTIPPGPQRDSRDESMRLQKKQGELDWTTSSEAHLRKIWEEFRELFGYDAYDDADTWWVEWGMLFERMNASDNHVNTNGDFFSGQVTVEEAHHFTMA